MRRWLLCFTIELVTRRPPTGRVLRHSKKPLYLAVQVFSPGAVHLLEERPTDLAGLFRLFSRWCRPTRDLLYVFFIRDAEVLSLGVIFVTIWDFCVEFLRCELRVEICEFYGFLFLFNFEKRC